MNAPPTSRLPHQGSSGIPHRGSPSLALSCAALAIIVGALFIPSVWFANGEHGAAGVQAVAIAATVCWLASTLALVAVARFGGTDRSVHGILGGMLVRLGLPLVVGVFFSQRGGPIAEAGVFGYIVLFYLVTLVAETGLALRMVKPTSTKKPRA